MNSATRDPAASIEAALTAIRRSQQRGALQRIALPNEDARHRNLTAAKFRYLDALADAGQGLGIAELGERIGVDQPRASRLTAELERAGLIVRTPDPGDRRRQLVTLTAAGQAPLRQAADLRRARVTRALTALNAAERRQLAELLTRFLAAWD